MRRMARANKGNPDDAAVGRSVHLRPVRRRGGQRRIDPDEPVADTPKVGSALVADIANFLLGGQEPPASRATRLRLRVTRRTRRLPFHKLVRARLNDEWLLFTLVDDLRLLPLVLIEVAHGSFEMDALARRPFKNRTQ